jgi:hypothetical protein
MILTPEEQTEYREEIDHAIETHGYEYVWGKETAMDKTKGLLRDAPGQIINGLQKLATNPTIISINEKLAAHNAKLCEQDAKQRKEQPRNRKNPPRASKPLPTGLDFGNDHL